MKTQPPPSILTSSQLSRRRFVTGMAAGSAALGLGLHSSLSLGKTVENGIKRSPPQVLRGNKFDLEIGYQMVNMTGQPKMATTINGSLPAPILRWKEGERVTLRVKNNLAHDSSIHWHGMILPYQMTVVVSDEQNIEPVSVDEFRIGVAETYDVVVEPADGSVYTIFLQSIDRTGFTRGVLTSDASLQLELPPMVYPPTLVHSDIGMSMAGMDHSAHAGMASPAVAMDHGNMGKISLPADSNKTDHRMMGHDSAPIDHSKMSQGSAPNDQSKMDHSNMSQDSMPMNQNKMDQSKMGQGSISMNQNIMDHSKMGQGSIPMDQNKMDHSKMGRGSIPMDQNKMDQSKMGRGSIPMDQNKMNHSKMGQGSMAMDHSKLNQGGSKLGRAGYGTNSEIFHVKTEFARMWMAA